tara:strand:- start:4409 stop:5830 length:1422 start_codon:yes stop_codon:yes gene_type:complete
MENQRPEADQVIQTIADYVMDTPIESELAFDTAKHCLMDSLGCAILALNYPACKKLLGPWVKGASMKKGARVIGTDFELDPMKAAFDMGSLIRWLDFNDTWLAKEWGHPSDNFGALLSVMDYVGRNAEWAIQYTVKDLLEAAIKAYEIQGILALDNSFNQVGMDHVVLVKVASSAVVTKLMGGTKAQVVDAITQAWVDGQSLRTYRHSPNTGSRKSWAAGDAVSRAIRLAMLTLQGENGYPSVLTAEKWGFQDSSFRGESITLSQELSSYVMENILFKISYPAEFHAQTAVKAALILHPEIKYKLDDIEQVTVYTQEAGKKIIDKKGPLYNPADRDHCIQYMVAVALMKGDLTADSYEDSFAENPKIDELRAKMVVKEDPKYTQDYFDPEKRAIPNRVEIRMKNDDHVYSHESHYPIGHRINREQGIPLLYEKFQNNVDKVYPKKVQAWLKLFEDKEALFTMSVNQFMDKWVM